MNIEIHLVGGISVKCVNCTDSQVRDFSRLITGLKINIGGWFVVAKEEGGAKYAISIDKITYIEFDVEG